MERHIVKKHTEYILTTRQKKDDNIFKKRYGDGFRTGKIYQRKNDDDLMNNSRNHMEETFNRNNRTLSLCYKDHQVDKVDGTSNNSKEVNQNKIKAFEYEMLELHQDDYIQDRSHIINDNNRIIKPLDFICQLCNISVSSEKQLDYHLAIHYNLHQDSNRYDCDVCGVNFNTKIQMKQHKRRHFSLCHKKKHIKDSRKRNRNYIRHRRQESCFDENSKKLINNSLQYYSQSEVRKNMSIIIIEHFRRFIFIR